MKGLSIVVQLNVLIIGVRMKYIIRIRNPHSSEGDLFVGRLLIPTNNKKYAQKFDNKLFAERQASIWQSRGYTATVEKV